MSNSGLENKYRTKKGPNQNSSVALTAVALQDHWVRTLALGKTFGPKQVGVGTATRNKQRKPVKSLIDTGIKGKKENKSIKEEEYVLDAKPPSLTLAQKFGLIDAPKQLLTEEEWHGVKVKSNKRDDSQEPCVICKEVFGLQQQVLLSCSHVFHRACLQAFEKYTGKKTCPMCRHEQYQSRVIYEGSKQFRIQCATRIQALWRGYVVKCWYKKLRQSLPPSDPKLRQKYFEEKLQTITDRMVKSCDFNLNDFLQEIDQSLQASRNVFQNFDAMFNILSDVEWEQIQLKAVIREDKDCPICLQNLTIKPTGDGYDKPDKKSNSAIKNHTPNSKTKSSKVMKDLTTKKCKSGQCSSDTPDRVNSPLTKGKRQTILLSCSHVFHFTCLSTLEELTTGDLRNICPVCRTVYQKKVINL